MMSNLSNKTVNAETNPNDERNLMVNDEMYDTVENKNNDVCAFWCRSTCDGNPCLFTTKVFDASAPRLRRRVPSTMLLSLALGSPDPAHHSLLILYKSKRCGESENPKIL